MYNSAICSFACLCSLNISIKSPIKNFQAALMKGKWNSSWPGALITIDALNDFLTCSLKTFPSESASPLRDHLEMHSFQPQAEWTLRKHSTKMQLDLHFHFWRFTNHYSSSLVLLKLFLLHHAFSMLMLLLPFILLNISYLSYESEN